MNSGDGQMDKGSSVRRIGVHSEPSTKQDLEYSCERGNEPSGSKREGGFLDWLSVLFSFNVAMECCYVSAEVRLLTSPLSIPQMIYE
jgi:hypothetical protein